MTLPFRLSFAALAAAISLPKNARRSRARSGAHHLPSAAEILRTRGCDSSSYHNSLSCTSLHFLFAAAAAARLVISARRARVPSRRSFGQRRKSNENKFSMIGTVCWTCRDLNMKITFVPFAFSEKICHLPLKRSAKSQPLRRFHLLSFHIPLWLVSTSFAALKTPSCCELIAKILLLSLFSFFLSPRPFFLS